MVGGGRAKLIWVLKSTWFESRRWEWGTMPKGFIIIGLFGWPVWAMIIQACASGWLAGRKWHVNKVALVAASMDWLGISVCDGG
jgi:hypothetical protein